MNSEQNGRELMFMDTKSKTLNKFKKRKYNPDDVEIAQMIEGSRQDDDYIYLKYETPEENKQNIKDSNDKAWQPSSSGSSSHHKKVKKVKSSTNTTDTSAKSGHKGEKHSISTESNEHAGEKSTKKYKKGLATPKQRLAKKLKMSR